MTVMTSEYTSRVYSAFAIQCAAATLDTIVSHTNIKMQTRKRRVCVTVLLWLLTIKRVKTDGKLDIRFISYWSDGRESSGYCCDSSYRTGCLDKCDPMFTLCIDGPDRRRPCSVYKTTTNYIDNHDIIYFGGSYQGTPNPFTVHISKAIPSPIEIEVDVYDNDDTSSDDHMDTLSDLINIQAAATQQEAMYTPYTLWARTSLKIAVRAYCDRDWYGSTCEKYCKATPDHSHYTCHPRTGAEMCSEGWKGDNCNQDIDECTESDHICQNGGSCTNTPGSFECICVARIKGKLCENIINQCALKPCLNGGTCDGNEADFKCACSVEWTGETCADKVNVCASAPCNRGYCSAGLLTATRFKCDCDFPWVGERCNQSVDIFNITLLGEIDHTNRGDLADGLKRLVIELGGIPGKVDVNFRTNIKKESNYTTTHVHLYSAVGNGSFLESSSFDRIFESNPDEVIDEYLPLPLFPPREEEEVKAKSPHDSWDTNQYVSAILPPVGLVLMLVLLLVAFFIWRRSNKTEHCRDDNQLDIYVMDMPCNRNLQPPGAGNLQEASVSPDGYTSLRFLGSPDTHCDETSNIISLAVKDITLDPESLEGFDLDPDDTARLGDAAGKAHRDDTSNIHLTIEDMNLDQVIIHCFRVFPNDNGRLGDVTLDPVMLQDARSSPHDNTRHSDVATLHDVQVATLETHCDEASNAIPRTEIGSLESVRLSGYLDGHTRLGDFGTHDTRRHVTSYIQRVPGDMTLDPGDLEEEEDNAEYTVIDNNYVEDPLQEDPYETIEPVDDKDDENISQTNPYEKINV